MASVVVSPIYLRVVYTPEMRLGCPDDIKPSGTRQFSISQFDQWVLCYTGRRNATFDNGSTVVHQIDALSAAMG